MRMNYKAISTAIVASTAILLAAAQQDAPKDGGNSPAPPAADPQKDAHKGHNHKHAGATIGHAAPEFTLKSVDGKTYNLSDYKGNIVILEWFCSTCPASGNGDNSYWGSGSATTTVAGVKAADPTAIYLAINSTKDGHQQQTTAVEGAASAAVITKAGQAIPILVDADGKVGRAYGAKTTPHVFIVDGTGNIAYIGAPTSDDGKTNYIVNAVTALKAGKPVAPATTKNKGCGIKYAK
ncbi:MAG: redoxin domain-containing protein [Phycisphaerales bacterium]|nr:redoxin domain-containing protein [Phycisphaerales bacterium]